MKNNLFINEDYFKNVAEDAKIVQEHNGLFSNDLHMYKVRFFEDNKKDIWHCVENSSKSCEIYSATLDWFIEDQILEEYEDKIVTAILENINEFIDSIEYTRQKEMFTKCQKLILTMDSDISMYYHITEGEPYEE